MAAAKEISTDAAVEAVLSALDSISIKKKEQKMALNSFSW